MLAKISHALPALSPAQRRVGRWILDHPREAAGITLARLAAALNHGPGEALAIPADLRLGTGRESARRAMHQAFGGIDVLINNAGLGLYGRLCDLPTTEWERLMQVNLMAPTRLCARFSRDAIRRGSGHIVNICSLMSELARPTTGAYAAASNQ